MAHWMIELPDWVGRGQRRLGLGDIGMLHKSVVNAMELKPIATQDIKTLEVGENHFSRDGKFVKVFTMEIE